MAPKILLSILMISSLSYANNNIQGDKLTEIERETCNSFPMITPPAQMKKGLHYKEETYCTDEDSNGNCNDWSDYLSFEYAYMQVTVTDYYTSAGKLVTSKTSKYRSTLSAIGDTTTEGAANLKLEVEKALYTSTNPTCKDSYYK